jgi:protease-4
MTEPRDALPADDKPTQARRASNASSPQNARASRLPGCLFGLSLLVNLVALVALVAACLGAIVGTASDETYHSGDKNARDKIAIVDLEGIILEGLLSNVHKEIETAAKDKHVKAVVLRINSPGGSVTASEDLHRRITKLRDGDKEKDYPARPLVVSMGSVAASGGYYAAVPGQKIYAEKTTTTASIGVYAMFPNIKELDDKYGIKVNTIKAGEIKAAGSMFGELSPKEQQVLQDMIDEAYLQFLGVVEKDRPKLTKAVMLERFTVKPVNPDPHLTKKGEPYTRYRADGGTFTGPKAKELGLVDEIGFVEDAIKAAAELAKLDGYKVVEYAKPKTLRELVMGRSDPVLPDLARIEHALSPRLWHLAPGHEGAAMAAAARASR